MRQILIPLWCIFIVKVMYLIEENTNCMLKNLFLVEFSCFGFTSIFLTFVLLVFVFLSFLSFFFPFSTITSSSLFTVLQPLIARNNTNEKRIRASKIRNDGNKYLIISTDWILITFKTFVLYFVICFLHLHLVLVRWLWTSQNYTHPNSNMKFGHTNQILDWKTEDSFYKNNIIATYNNFFSIISMFSMLQNSLWFKKFPWCTTFPEVSCLTLQPSASLSRRMSPGQGTFWWKNFVLKLS